MAAAKECGSDPADLLGLPVNDTLDVLDESSSDVDGVRIELSLHPFNATRSSPVGRATSTHTIHPMGDRTSVVQGRRRLLLVAAGIVAAASLPSTAQAHAFLVGSNPPAGAHLGVAPTQIVLELSEPYVRGSEHVAVQRADGTELRLAAPSGAGTVVRQPLPPYLRGIFVVSWHLVSVDGHLSSGQLAFSVGAGGALPAVNASAAPTPWSQVVASWLFFVGLALAFGGLLSEQLVWRARARAPVAFGVTLAAVSSLALLVLLAGAQTDSGFSAGLHGAALRAAYQTRPGALTLAVVGTLVLAAPLLLLGRARALALVPLAAAAILTSARGHAGTSGHWWAPAVESIHLLAVAAWIGALVHLALVLVRAPDRSTSGGAAIRRYSRLALPTVLVVLASGVLSAFAEFRSVHSVFHSSYGQTLVVKSAIVFAALAVASASRFLTLPALPDTPPPLRRLTLSEATLVVAALAAAGLLTNLAPPRATAARSVGPGSIAAIVPARVAPQDVPTGPFTSAREAGDLAVAFAAQPAGAGTVTLTTTVIGQDGNGATAVRVDVALASKTQTRGPAVACAAGCYRVTLPFTGRPRSAVVTIRRAGHLPATVRFDFPPIWTPPSAVGITSAATLAFDRLRSVSIDEYLRSNPSYTAHARWRLESPNRLTYTTVGGPQGVIIGNRRWDRDSSRKKWVVSQQLPVHQPTATWGAAPRQAALLSSGRIGGREVWRVSFVDPNVPAWYTAEIDKRTLRTLAVQMVAPAHFMRHTYFGFNTPPTIQPPK